jgi:hypothetical protein
MTHVRTSPYYPQSNGKIERWHKSLKGECIRPGTPLSLEDARRLIKSYVGHYNNIRLVIFVQQSRSIRVADIQPMQQTFSMGSLLGLILSQRCEAIPLTYSFKQPGVKISSGQKTRLREIKAVFETRRMKSLLVRRFFFFVLVLILVFLVL